MPRRVDARDVLDADATTRGNLAIWLHGELEKKPEPND